MTDPDKSEDFEKGYNLAYEEIQFCLRDNIRNLETILFTLKTELTLLEDKIKLLN